jgi:hypothetical protein
MEFDLQAKRTDTEWNPAHELLVLLQQAKKLAKRYLELTGRPLGITGEIAEAEAARLLNLELAPARTAGYDALRGTERLQIKGRVLHPKGGIERVGAINKDKDWDAVLLVILDQNYDAAKIYEASREVVITEMARHGPDSEARAKGKLQVSTFCQIAQQVWPAPTGS